MLLATALGLPKADFRDADGNRLYAAFTAVRIHNAQLGLVEEGDEIRLLRRSAGFHARNGSAITSPSVETPPLPEW